MSCNSISAATPMVASSQSSALAVVECIARLTGRSPRVRRASRQLAIMFAAQPHEPATRRVSPM